MAWFRGFGLALALVASAGGAAPAGPPRDGSHDFDFILHDWHAHVRRLPDRLVGSTRWIEYDGTANHRSLMGSPANWEEFEVSNAAGGHIKAQTLRLYNRTTGQWWIYPVDVDNGTLGMPPVIGRFEGKRGEFIDQEPWNGRMILVRYVWLDQGPHAARMEQSFSDDNGRTWEVNWICEMTR